jgi:hypothetical protein
VAATLTRSWLCVLAPPPHDPCEAVALAAAHALTTAGRTAPLERFLSEHPGGRAESITASLELLA